MSSLAVGTASFLQGCLLHLSLHDNCRLHAQHHVQVHVDHYHADHVPALLQINIGLKTVNISAFNNRVFYYNEQFQILNGNLDEQLREALEKGAPDFILSVLEFLSDSHTAVPIKSTSYKIRYLLNMIFICWLFSLIVFIFIPHLAFKFFLFIDLSSCTICILYYWSTPHTLLLHIGQTCIVFNLGRSFYMSAAGGLSYTLLARACGVPVGRRSGGRLAMTLVAIINVIIFFFLFSPSSTFLIEGVLGSKNLLF